MTGGSGEETLSFADASGNIRDIAANAPADPAKPAATGAQPPPRQFAGKLDRRRHAVAQVRRRPTSTSWAFAVIPDKPPVIRFSGEPKRAVNGTLELQL